MDSNDERHAEMLRACDDDELFTSFRAAERDTETARLRYGFDSREHRAALAALGRYEAELRRRGVGI